MSLHSYSNHSAIKSVAFHHAANRLPVALVSAAAGVPPERLAPLRQALTDAGFSSVPVHVDGGAALQVGGFQQASEIDALLRARGLVEGEAVITRLNGDDKADAKGWFKNIPLKLAGIFNLVGNTGMVIDGIRKPDPYRLAGGALLTLGSLNLVRYGNAGPDYHTHKVAEDLAGFMCEQGIDLPPGSRLHEVISHKRTGAMAAVERVLYEKPAEVTLGIGTAGASALLVSGVRKMKGKEGWGGLGFGVGSLGLKLTSMLLPEKTPEEIAKSAAETSNPIAKTIDWFRAKPLRIYGLFSAVTDVFLGVDAYHQYKREPGKKGYIYTAVSGACFLGADVMLSFASKNHVNDDGKFNAHEQRGIEAMAAESLVRQPEAQRAEVARKLGGYLERRKEVQGDAASISRAIIEQAAHMRDNPWVSRVAGEEYSAPVRAHS